MVGSAPDYEVDSLFYFFLDQVVDWAEEFDINLILDNHTFDPIAATDPGYWKYPNPGMDPNSGAFMSPDQPIYFMKC